MRVEALFVEPHPEDLRDFLHAARRAGLDWHIRTAASGEEALSLLQQRVADVVVSAMRMPGMDGGVLLSLVRQTYPSAVRLILSAESGVRGFMRATSAAHQVLSKPCDVGELQRVVEETLRLQARLRAPELVDAMHRVGPLPSLPHISQKLEERLRDEYATLNEVASLVGADSAIVARVLNIANSSYFRRGSEILDMQTAVSRLGFELIRSLVLTRELYALLPSNSTALAEVQHDNEVAVQVSEVACFIAGKQADQRELLTVSVLCNVGKLLRLMLPVPVPGNLPDALIGAYLLSLWGLPFRLVQSVAFVDEPASLLTEPVGMDVWPSAVLIHLARCLFSRLKRSPDVVPRWDCEVELDQRLLAHVDPLQLQAWEDGLRRRADQSRGHN